MSPEQREIEELLARRIGLDPVSTGPHVILAAARRRMAELSVENLLAGLAGRPLPCRVSAPAR